MSDFLQIIVPVISVFVSYWLGRIQQERKYRRDQAQKRYDAFYVPFFTKLYAGQLWQLRPSSFGLEARGAFLDLLTHNLGHLGPKTQACYPDLYVAFCAMLSYDNDVPGSDGAPEHYDRAFRRTVSAAIAESRELCRELHLPPISATYESCRRRVRQRKPRRASAGRK